MIELLNRYFVPVTSQNEEAAEQSGSAPPEEKKERQRIYLEFFNRKLGIGDVHVYIVGPDKAAIASLPINEATDNGKMIAFLQGIATKLNVAPGGPAVKPHPQSHPPAAPADSLVIHLLARAFTNGEWHNFPAENWIILKQDEWSQLLPAGEAAPKATWTVPKPLAVRLAEWVYPASEEKTGVNRSRVDQADFRLTTVTVEGGLARARIDGKIRLLHSFYPGGQAQDFAVSELTGFMDFNIGERRIQRLRIVTTKAHYNDTPFAASLVSKSKETLEALAP